MPDRRLHRGPHPEDAETFGAGALPRLRAAAGDFCWLLDRGYPRDSALRLVGDRYDLVARQRTAVSRCCCSQSQAAARRRRLVGRERIEGTVLWIDGYNVLTTIEAALAGGVILVGRDGAYRDMASMHGTYRKVAETLPALELLGRTLAEDGPSQCRWLLDSPVSNSGRLRAIIEQTASAHGWPWTVELVPDPDAVLIQGQHEGQEGDSPIFADAKIGTVPDADAKIGTVPAMGFIAVTADSAILDRGGPWFNLAREAIGRHAPSAHVVELLEDAMGATRWGDAMGSDRD